MAISRLEDHNSYDYTFKFQRGAVKHLAQTVAQLVFSDVKLQGNIPIEVKVYSLAIPFNVSPAGLRELKRKKYKVIRKGGIGLSALSSLSTHMDKLVSNKPKVNI